MAPQSSLASGGLHVLLLLCCCIQWSQGFIAVSPCFRYKLTCSGRVRVSGLSTQLHDSHLQLQAVLEQNMIAETPLLSPALSLLPSKRQHTPHSSRCGVSQLRETLERHEQRRVATSSGAIQLDTEQSCMGNVLALDFTIPMRLLCRLTLMCFDARFLRIRRGCSQQTLLSSTDDLHKRESRGSGRHASLIRRRSGGPGFSLRANEKGGGAEEEDDTLELTKGFYSEVGRA